MFLDSKGAWIRLVGLSLALSLAGCGADEEVSSATDEARGQVAGSVEAGPGGGSETGERVKRDVASALDPGAAPDTAVALDPAAPADTASAVEREWSDGREPIRSSIDGS